MSVLNEKRCKNQDLENIKLLLENNTNLNVFPGDTNLQHVNYYQNVTDYILRIVKNSEFLCKNLYLEDIIEGSENSDFIVVIGTKGIDILPNGNILGFAFIKFNEEDNSININIICSHVGVKYGGDRLIKMIDIICKNLFVKKIKLLGVPSAIPFYEKYGFIKSNSCIPNKTCEMTKIIVDKKFGGKIKTKNKKSKKKQTKKN